MSAVARAVVAWQRRHGRHGLPWQHPREPYRVWVSEIMLQQTQVATVLGYFQRFMQRFPTVQALAAAPLDDVLALWAGLGYYSRARNLHRCAQVVVTDHDGWFPQSAQALATLPGIGPSTAAAIAAFCFRERVAILDGNVKRVLARVLGFDEDLANAGAQRRLWALATDLLPTDGDQMPDYTQGLMDLGATLCAVRQPRCESCPLRTRCRARAEGRIHELPRKSRRLVRSTRESWWLWVHAGPDLLLVQRPPSGIWGGLFVPPEFDSEVAWREAMAKLGAASVTQLPSVKHVLTHLDWTLHAARVDLPSPRLAASLARLPGARWVAVADLDAHGLPAPFRRQLLTSP